MLLYALSLQGTDLWSPNLHKNPNIRIANPNIRISKLGHPDLLYWSKSPVDKTGREYRHFQAS